MEFFMLFFAGTMGVFAGIIVAILIIYALLFIAALFLN